jgi:ADP-heptose:LPS heptosyltransferase
LFARARTWRRLEYDLAINFEGDIRTHALMRLSAAPRRFGFDMAGGGPMLTHRVPFDPSAHVAANVLGLVARAFEVSPDEADRRWLAPVRGGEPRLSLPEAAKDRARRWIGSARKPLVGVHVSGGRAIKQWPPERFGAVGATLARDHGATLVFTGAPADQHLIDRALRELPSGARAIQIPSETGLVDVAAVLQQLDVLVTGDTGPMHLADAVGTPVAAIFGLTDPRRWGPLSQESRVVRIDLWCSPCNQVRRPPARCVGIVPDCLSGIDPETVVRAATDVLVRRGAIASATPIVPLHRM